jgi:hypothetical protein
VDASGDAGKGGPTGLSRTAEQPGQTVNVDLCFVPARHLADEHLPAVSGSSGRLVVSPPATTDLAAERTWPGRVFEQAEVPYAEAMHAFVAASAPRLAPGRQPPPVPLDQQAAAVQQRTVRQQAATLRDQRRQVRSQRHQEDTAWQALWEARRTRTLPDRWTAAAWDAYQAEEVQWRALRAERQATLAQRQAKDAAWRAQRAPLQAALTGTPSAPPWLAILVLTDNCTRQCLGLPLFLAGPKVTSALIVEALDALLPPDLAFLISDRGTHFTAHEFARCADAHGFVHVLIARHRPESNGIAERFVRTLKEWLADQAWAAAEDLAPRLVAFQHEYNARPHQGLGLPGLSPDEFANRIWLL